MPKKLAIVTVHGMGETKENYARNLEKQLIAKLRQDMENVAFCPVYYQDILQPNQEAVWEKMRQAGGIHYDELRKFLLFGFSDAAGFENQKEQPNSVYEETQKSIARALLAAREQMQGDGPVIVVAQSLGCQVFSSYLYDAQKSRGIGANVGIWKNIDRVAHDITGKHALTAMEKSFLIGDNIQALVTTGCNIPIFVAAHKRMAIKPIARPSAGFRWLNFYDPDDVLGWPLRSLSDEYDQLVEDYKINAGHGVLKWLQSWTPLSHSAYWDDHDVIDPIVQLIRARMPK
jgi:hypothetical protein